MAGIIWWNRSQALAWVVWRDEKSVVRVGPSGDISFAQLYAERKALARARARYSAPVRPEAALALPIDADGVTAIERARQAKLSGYTAPLSRFEIPEMIGSPADLDDACAGELLTAYGRFSGGEREPIPAMQCAHDGPSARWTKIVYKAAELRQCFPLLTNDGATLAATGTDAIPLSAAPKKVAPGSSVVKPKKRRPRKPAVAGLITEGVGLVNNGQTKNSAAIAIAAREWQKNRTLANSENALADQIRRGISAELGDRNSSG
jgi:hypothetical protein